MTAFQILLISMCVGLIRSNSTTTDKGTGRISHGTPFDPKQFPYVVILGTLLDPPTKTGYCTGTLVSELFVITATHCVVDVPEKQFVKRATSRMTVWLHSPNGEKRNVEKTYVPESYTEFKKSDVSLLKLQSRFNETVEFVKLYGDSSDLGAKGMQCTAIGFGINEDEKRQREGMTAEILLQSGKEGCGYGSGAQMADGYWEEFLCQRPNEQQTCPGDSGGPVICNGVQYATSSHSFDYINGGKIVCGSNNTLAVYQYLKPYKSWIDNIVSGNGAPNSTGLYRNMFAMITILLLWTNIKNVIF